MAKEIERKYLVKSESYRSAATESFEISQGYLSRRVEATVRVRIKGDRAFLTVKSSTHGVERDEWEYPIPVEDARQMLSRLCEGSVLSKTRYIVPGESGVWEVDEFHGRLQGLVIAEIELPDAAAEIVLPDFVGEEVSDDPAYYNSNLAAQA